MPVMKSTETLHLHQTQIDMPASSRSEMIDLLNQTLAHLIDLKLHVKQAHWNVRGMRFIALHELFDMLAKELEEHVDLVAERATTLGGVAIGDAENVCKSSTLESYPLTIVSGEDHLKALINRYAQVGKLVRNNIEEAEHCKDRGSADLLTQVSRGLDLRLWFLEAHLQDH